MIGIIADNTNIVVTKFGNASIVADVRANIGKD